jgi:hypothetical protein
MAQAQSEQEKRAACQGDAFRLCSHAIPSRDRVRACLYTNLRQVSPACRSLLVAARN